MKITTQRNVRRVDGVAFLTIALLLGCGDSRAVEIDATVSASIGRSNNVLRTADNQISETIATVGTELSIFQATRKFNADIYVNADYVDYLDDAFDNDVVGGATMLSSYSFVEDVLDWTLQWNYGQQVFDPLAPIRPDNRENVSYLTTGPQLDLPLGSRFELKANAQYSDVTYEINPNDHNRLGGRLSIGRILNNNATLALVGTTEKVEYDQLVLNPDFQRNGLFLRYELIDARNTFSIDFGVNELELDGLAQKSDGTLLRIDWLRAVSSGVEVQVSAGSRYSNQGDIFRFFQNAQFDLRDTQDVAGVATPFRNNFATVRFALAKPRTRFVLNYLFSDEDYEGNDVFDREVQRLNMIVERDFSRKIFGELGFSGLTRKFFLLNRDDTDYLYTLSVGYRLSEGLTTALSYQHFERSTNQGVTEFDEDRLFLRVSYVPKWTRE